MLRLTVDKLKIGMVLAQDVARDDGVILMGKGSAISEDSISLLERLEIESVVVEGDQFASDEEREAFLKEAEEQMEMRFSRVEDDKVLMAIREMFRKRIKSGCTPPPPPPPEEERYRVFDDDDDGDDDIHAYSIQIDGD
jgi:hypothetical protein